MAVKGTRLTLEIAKKPSRGDYHHFYSFVLANTIYNMLKRPIILSNDIKIKSRLTRGRARPNPSRETKFSGVITNGDRENENTHFPCSADHEQDWQPYPVDLYCATYVYVKTVYLLGLGLSTICEVVNDKLYSTVTTVDSVASFLLLYF